MDIDVARAVEEAAWDHSIEVELREDYSGRGMHGGITPGLVIDSGDEQAIGWLVGVLGYDVSDVPTRTDNMGRRIILY